MRSEIERLIQSKPNALQVAKATGIPQNTVYRIFRGEASLDNVTLGNAEKLYYYQKEMEKMKTIKVEKTGKFDHIIGGWEREYTGDMKLDFLNELDPETADYHEEEIETVKNQETGTHIIEDGDFVYSVEVIEEGEMKNTKHEEMLVTFEEIQNKVNGKLGEGVYIQMFDSMDEMLQDMELTIEDVEENMGFIHAKLPKDGPFIVRDYNQEDFVFLDSAEEHKVQEFIDYLLAK